MGKPALARFHPRLPLQSAAVRSAVARPRPGSRPLLSLLDRFLLAFRRDLAQAPAQHPDHYTRLYWDDRPAFIAALHDAWATGRPEPFISLAKAAALNEGLSVKVASRLAMRLNQAGRWKQAIGVLHDPRYRLLETGAGQLELARAALGLGRLHEAAVAAAAARDLDASRAAAAQEIEVQAAETRALQAAARKTGAWPEAEALIQRWIELGAPRLGRQVLTSFLAGEAPLDRNQLEDFHLLLDTLISLDGRASAYSLFRAMERIATSAKVKQDLQTIAAGLYGAPSRPGPELPIVWRSSNLRLHISGALAWGRAGRLEAAVDAFGDITADHPRLSELRPQLQRVIGRDLLRRRPLVFAPPGPGRRVFDVFPFNNELRMLKLKLHEMSDWVDGFVLVEARQTFTGAPKPLVFQENKDQFAEFASKIVHVVVDAFPPYVRRPWAREYHQRDMGLVGLDGRVSEDDLVIISDADEILSRDFVLGFEGEYASLAMERSRYFMNYCQALPADQLKVAASLWRARYLGELGLSTARDTLRFDKRSSPIGPSGWHFTSIGDASAIRNKMDSTSHQEHAGAPVEAFAAMLSRLRAGEREPGWERLELDERFPAYLRANREAFEDVLL